MYFKYIKTEIMETTICAIYCDPKTLYFNEQFTQK